MRWTVLILVVVGCRSRTIGAIDEHTSEARLRFPDLAALYEGEQGIYRGCGPNSGVCHNGNELPDLDTVGSVLDNMERPCNEKRESAEAVDDLCEPHGDLLAIDGRLIELAWVIPADVDGAAMSRRWRIGLREAPSVVTANESLTITRDDLELWHLGRYGTAEFDPDDARVLVVTALPAPTTGSDPGIALETALSGAGVPALPEALRVGDPNRNGVYGAIHGGRLIKPGDPAASYLLHRLTDPAAGPLMPRANCCAWSLSAVRAMWCWIDGLERDGSNAMEPIDYDNCSPSPNVELLYPEPGPSCDTSGLCPVGVDLTDNARFPALYANVLAARCSGGGCHDTAPVGGLDFSSAGRALATLRTKIVPGNPEASILYKRISPELCTDSCKTMPLDRDVLPEDERELIRAWIQAGAPAE